MENKQSGFFKMPTTDMIALIVFFAVSIIAFFPFITNAMWQGLTMNSWLLSVLALAVPIYDIIAAYSDAESRHEKD